MGTFLGLHSYVYWLQKGRCVHTHIVEVPGIQFYYNHVITEKYAFIVGNDIHTDKTVPTGITACICIVWSIVQSRLSNYPYSERNALNFSLFMKSVEPVPADGLWMLLAFSCKHSQLWGRLLQNLTLSAINEEKGKSECIRIFPYWSVANL